jgi:hypothetical protein
MKMIIPARYKTGRILKVLKNWQDYNRIKDGNHYLLPLKNKPTLTHIHRKNLFTEEKMGWDY